MRTPPFQIEVYDKAFARKGAIGDPKFVTLQLSYNRAGNATISLPNSHRMIPHLMTPGSRIWFRDDDGGHLLSGRVTRLRGSGPARSGFVEFDVIDDFSILSEVLGWVVPTAAITGQGSAGENWTMTGPAETVLKTAVDLNAIDRLGLPITLGADLGRGSTIKAKLRMHPLYDRLFPVIDGAGLDNAGIGVYVKQQGAGLLLDVYTPSTYPRPLTELGGAITEWSYSLTSPTATRVVVGGQGEAQARVWRNYVDSTRETDVGWKIERFRDARDVDDVADLPARGQETLDEGAARAGFAVVLAGTKHLTYKTVRLGDMMTMSVGIGTQTVPITDVLRDLTLSYTRDEGFRFLPKIGERADDPDTMLVKYVRKLGRLFANTTRT